jgi:SPP1 gp7 family putative phage head morphogenesis protein
MVVPAALYRNAIDLNRYSNSVARRIINAYNDMIINAVDQLRTIDELSAPNKAARLRGILQQLKESLGTWAGDSTELATSELQGLAELQSEFVAEQLRKALPKDARRLVNTVEISPQFAESVVTTDPTQINVVTLSDDLIAAVQGAPQTFSLTASQGTTITLPNGKTIEKAFRGLAVDQAERFSQTVRTGLLSGETTPQIAKKLIGSLQFGEEAKSVRQLIAAGGQSTAIADNQIMTLVRTSINQVANTASQQVYEANQDITKKYKYVATLDTKTSPICRALDGKEFEYGKGPMPPQHFNCRSTTVPIVDYEGLKEAGYDFVPPAAGRRASMDGPVPANTTYGKWLYDQPASVKADVLGKSKVAYFDKLTQEYGADNAMAKLVRDDGSELTLDQLRRRYGKIDA